MTASRMVFAASLARATRSGVSQSCARASKLVGSVVESEATTLPGRCWLSSDGSDSDGSIELLVRDPGGWHSVRTLTTTGDDPIAIA